MTYRRREMATLRHVLQGAVPLKSRLGGMRRVFETVLGPRMSEGAWLHGERDGELYVVVRSEILIRTLQTVEGLLVKSINERVDGPQIRRVKYVVGRPKRYFRTDKNSLAAAASPSTELSPGRQAVIREMAATVTSDRVRSSLMSWMQAAAVRDEREEKSVED